jgi:hypothetical protein
MITMIEQVVPHTVAQSIIVIFLIDENVKPAGILRRLRGDETL